MAEEKTTPGFLVEIRQDSGIAAATWFDNEDAAFEYENLLWERGYLEGISTDGSGMRTLGRYPMAQCRTWRFPLTREMFARDHDWDFSIPPPYTSTYNWHEADAFMRERQAKTEKDLLDHSKGLEDAV